MKKETPLHYFKEIKKVSLKNLVEVPKLSTTSMYDRPNYRTGDGDFVSPIRPGADDHKQWKSKGLLSSNLG